MLAVFWRLISAPRFGAPFRRLVSAPLLRRPARKGRLWSTLCWPGSESDFCGGPAPSRTSVLARLRVGRMWWPGSESDVKLEARHCGRPLWSADHRKGRQPLWSVETRNTEKASASSLPSSRAVPAPSPRPPPAGRRRRFAGRRAARTCNLSRGVCRVARPADSELADSELAESELAD